MVENLSSLDAYTPKTKEIPGLSPEKTELLEKIAGDDKFQTFQMILSDGIPNEITQDEKTNLLLILNSTNNLKLNILLKNKFTFIDGTGIRNFINNPQFTHILEQQTTQQERQTTQQERQTKEQKSEIAQQEGQITKQKSETAEQKEKDDYNTYEKSYHHIRNRIDTLTNTIHDETFNSLLEQLRSIDSAFGFIDGDGEGNLETYIKRKDLQERSKEAVQQIADYLSTHPQKTQEIFAELQDDPESYEALYTFLSSNATAYPELRQVLTTIPSSPRESRRASRQIDTLLKQNPYFPQNSSPDAITQRGQTLSISLGEYRSKSVDLSSLPPQTYIEGKNGYRIPTQTISPELLHLRSAFTQDKIQIDNQQQEIRDKKLTPLHHMLETYDQEELLSQKSSLEKQLSGEGLSIEDEMQIESQIFDIDELLELFAQQTRFEEQLTQLDDQLIQRENKFLQDYGKEIGKNSNEVDILDTQAQDTLTFLDDIGCTHIPFHDFLWIQQQININPQYYGFQAPLDLQKGFRDGDSGEGNSKREFMQFLNVLYGTEIDLPISYTDTSKLGDRFQSPSFFNELINNGLINQNGTLNKAVYAQRISQGYDSKE